MNTDQATQLRRLFDARRPITDQRVERVRRGLPAAHREASDEMQATEADVPVWDERVIERLANSY